MRRNLDALYIELYNAVSNWNDFTENGEGERILTQVQVGEYSSIIYEHLLTDMIEMELV